ncbi:YkgJ family cysteine cluster protein [Desulfobacterales bacterium HSG2]|nr:YkgJ family cysteine cluster protein [Desulfobacterales bacterium HSG2]
MTTSEKTPGIDPVKLDLDSEFKFECHKGVKCFTKCCRGINIVLTPYDIIRLKKRLQLPSDEFLAIYTKPELLEKTDLPVVTLKLLDDESESCAFVRDDGCIIYEDRPTACRYYPLGTASLSHKEGADDQDFYFFVNEPHCLGFEEDKQWDVREWRKDQGVDIHDEINAEWTDLLVRKRSFPPNIKLTDQSKKMFFMVSYDIDKFRQFVFESSFLDRYDIDKETTEKIREDEIALLKFGIQWLKSSLFDEGAFKTKQENAAS